MAIKEKLRIRKDKLKTRLNAIFYHTRKWVWFSTLALSIFLIILFGIAQYWLPTLVSDKAKVERYLSSLSKQTITVGKIQAAWDGIYPGVRASEIHIKDPRSEAGGIFLKEAQISLSYLSAIKGQAILHRIVLVEPDLELVRSRDGKVSVTGIRAQPRQQPKPVDDATNKNGAVAANWLLSQGLIEIRHGNLAWIDQTRPASGSLALADVNLSLQNEGNRHLLEFNAQFPEDICAVCSFKVDIEGNPLESKDWGGFVDVNAIGLNLRNRLSLMADNFPEGLNGKVDMVLRSQWAQGRPRIAFGRVTANDIDVPLGKFGKSLTVNEMVASLKWRGRKDTWSLDMKLPFVRVNNETWLPGQLKVSRYVGGTSLYLRHLDIAKAVKVAARFNIPDKPRQLVEKLKPAGDVDELYVDLRDKNEDDEADRLSVRADLVGIETSPYKKIPGVKGLSASIETTENKGEVFLNSHRSEFKATHVFREPIRLSRAKARITWQKKNNTIEVNTQNIQLTGYDANARGGFVFQLPLDKAQSPHLDLRAEIYNGLVARKSTYLPVNVLKPTLVEWLDKSIISGKLVDGHVIYRGNTREFPFVNNNGLFEVLVNVEHGKLQYLPGWKPISNANMTLLFRGHSMVITGSSGKVDQLNVNEIVARKQSLKDKLEPIHITGRLTGSVDNTLSVLRNAVANGQKGGWTRFVESDVRASGNGQLTLGIEIPVMHGRPHRLSGRFEFLGGDMVLPIGDIPAHNLRGAIRFSEKRLLDGVIHAQALGGPVELQASGGTTRREPDTTFRLQGKMTTRGLAREYGQWIGKYFNGSMPWSGELSFKNGIAHVALKGDAKGISTSLPEPVNQISRPSEELELYTMTSTEKRHVLRIALGSKANGVLDFHSQGSRWKFMEGHLLVGNGVARLQGNNQMFMEFNGDHLDGNAWADLVSGMKGGDDMPTLVRGVSGSFASVDFLGREWGQTEFRLGRPGKQTWDGEIRGASIDGKVRLSTRDKGGRISLDLQRLHVPKAPEEDDTRKGESSRPDPRNFPALVIDSADFSIGPMKLGKLNFSAERNRIGWEIERLQFTRPETSVFADGSWFVVAGDDVAQLKMRFTSTDLGKSLEAMGNPGQVTGGDLNLDLNLNWRQDRKVDKGVGNLNGEVSLHARNGTLNQVKTDAGGGPFSLFSLSRYLSLDFSPALGKGLAFNDIKGKVTIQRGDARTDGFTLSAPVASVVARGHIDMNRKDIDMYADIYPNLRGGVTVATGSLFGLQAAAWAYALQKLFSSEIEKGTRISYHISGKLDKPKVTKAVSKDQK